MKIISFYKFYTIFAEREARNEIRKEKTKHHVKSCNFYIGHNTITLYLLRDHVLVLAFAKYIVNHKYLNIPFERFHFSLTFISLWPLIIYKNLPTNQRKSHYSNERICQWGYYYFFCRLETHHIKRSVTFN